MFHPTFDEFKKLVKKGNLVPVYKEILADMETPVSAFYKIASGEKYSYLLESVEGGEKLGRYSFISSGASCVFSSKADTVSLETSKGTLKKKVKDPLAELQRMMRKYKPVKIKDLPRFWGGAVGYLSYDMVRFFEDIPDKNPDDLAMKDSIFVITDTMVIFDHVNHKIKVVSCAHVEKPCSDQKLRSLYKQACVKVDLLIKKLQKPVNRKDLMHGLELSPSTKELSLKVRSNFTRDEFRRAVLKAKQYIKAGDIIQVVLSQRFEVNVSVDAFDIYRSLRMVNPSPYMFYLDFNGIKTIGASPELLVRLEDKLVETRPIAGTRPRGETEAKDNRLAEELLRDTKERAEHIMLVDLGRNDIGRVCDAGSVTVPELMLIEKYSHVQHIVSGVKGTLSRDKDAADVIRACFPAGTVSGAPKIRAMEIIDELEPVRRGLYAGCIGYFSFSGNLDTCITIRTIVVKDDKAYVQAGAGIVADSKPQREYTETVNKARAMMKAIEMAEKGLE
ncbi:MAG: anthranilate synthase component I [bacterium]